MDGEKGHIVWEWLKGTIKGYLKEFDRHCESGWGILIKGTLIYIWTNSPGSETIFLAKASTHKFFISSSDCALSVWPYNKIQGWNFSNVFKWSSQEFIQLQIYICKSFQWHKSVCMWFNFLLGSCPSEPSTYWNILSKHQTVRIMFECYQTVVPPIIE